MTSEKRTVLALCAHPDDAEIRCFGTLILLAKLGWDVHIATLSSGDCGSAELSQTRIAAIRKAEAEDAAARIGGTYHSMGGTDLQVYDDNAGRAAGVALLREVNPDCIITHYPSDYMPDHVAASAVARMADFTAPIVNYAVGVSAALAPTQGIVPLYYFGPLGGTDFLGNQLIPQFYVDISSVATEKAEALTCHVSQREWLRRQHGIDQYVEEMKQWDAEAGACAGVEYAEGFFMHRGHAYPQTPIIQDALAELIKES